MELYEEQEASWGHQGFRLTPRDLRSGSGIYFEYRCSQDNTQRDNAYYTSADHKKEHEKGNEKQNKKEAHATKPASRTVTKVANLPLVLVSYKAHILTTTTRTVLTQSFYHPGNAPIDEATYRFPLYAGCSVVSFVCHVGPRKIISGVVQPKEVAKATYEKAKSQGHTAGLLKAFTPEIFKTSLGNIPAGVTVKVEITYLTELKHDTEVDGIRFTVPTSIAPRYGGPPEGLFGDKYETPTGKGMSLSIDITMGERIRTIESPSHKVSVQLGTHKSTTKSRLNLANQYDDKKALVTLSQGSTHLSGDFVLLVTTVTPMFLYTPMALLEAHPTIPGQQALMVTLVPCFAGLKSNRSRKREIIFIVDRSGSMHSMIAPLKSAMNVFVKSLPIGCKFNICSFGSKYSFLWENSQDYSAHTVRAALNLVDNFNANMGGTELLEPIQETVKRRLEDVNTEVIVLTDGEIWDEDRVLGFIKQATGNSKGNLRFFSIGLGPEVSHSLVEGIARIGGGYSQIIADGSDEQDRGGWEGKVVKMLKAALTEHIDHYSLQVIHDGFHETDEEDSDEEESIHPSAVTPGTANAGNSMPAPQAPKKLPLLDPERHFDITSKIPPSNDELPIGRPAVAKYPGLSEDRFSHLKRLENPGILQAPYQIPPLYSQVRTVAYLLISPTGDRSLRNPTSVKLQGTAPGIEREQLIPITRLAEPGLTIHQLAARMALRDLEDGSSWLHSDKHGINLKDDTFSEYVEREGESLSIKWGLASKWASFVAVEDEFLEKEASEKADPKANAMRSQGNSSIDGDDDYALPDSGSTTETPAAASIKTPDTDRPEDAAGALSQGGQLSAPIVALRLAKDPLSMVSAGRIPGAFSVMHAGPDSMSMLLQPRDGVTDGDWDQMSSPAPGLTSPVPTSAAYSGFQALQQASPTLYEYCEPFSDACAQMVLASAPSPSSSCDIGKFSEGASEISEYDIPIAETGIIRSRKETDTEEIEGNEEEIVYPEYSEYSSAPRSTEELTLPRPSTGRKFTCQEVSPPTSSNPSKNNTPRQKVVRIICLQEFMGSFPVTNEMAQLIGLELPDVENLRMELFPDKATDESKALAMTSLVVAYLVLEMHEHEDTWQMVVEKAREFLEEECERVEALKEKAEGIIEEKVLKDDEDLPMGDSV
ncbi:hypothetical protein HOY82DRAFT_582837 [Tuber indicum]|nr:hypothetical protein HOY82DRAFT_582837 [Tuber indicum]